ncbi:DNRLRE domain-containing protein [Halomicrobium sp. IBSBa]|uniref:CBM96 family carbohydrate-binding protein n=1 Tax=Halomicrobium sp. IBSBa TaxID=2778916 RepID=UPI001FCA2CE2|nr:DNRLRE domain-containing protein [Halomicrobium sp. IBSBa]
MVSRARTTRTVSVSGPAAVVIRHRNDELVIGVADPSRTQETVTVEYEHYTDGIVSTDSAVGVTQFQLGVTMEVAVGGTRGATHSATFDAPVTELSPRGDTFVRDGSYSGDNYGSWSSLVVKGGPTGYSRESYLAFDLASVAGEVREAVLDVYGAVTDDNGGASVDCTVAAVDDDSWTEDGLTWDTKPELGSSLGSLTVTRTPQWWTVDVTEFVQSEAGGDSVVSLAVQQPQSSLYTDFNSRDADEKVPTLRVQTS